MGYSYQDSAICSSLLGIAEAIGKEERAIVNLPMLGLPNSDHNLDITLSRHLLVHDSTGTGDHSQFVH